MARKPSKKTLPDLPAPEQTEGGDQLVAFVVIKTPKIKDSRNRYVKRGETAYLTEELAAHYDDLGFIKTDMTALFDKKAVVSDEDDQDPPA